MTLRAGAVLVAAAVCVISLHWIPSERASGAAPCGSGRPSDFNGDGFSDLAVGVPGEDVSGVADAGAVNVLYGSPSGLGASDDQLLTAATAGLEFTSDAFGSAVGAADFDWDGYGDLAVSMPGHDLDDSVADSGAIVVLYGSAAGLTGDGAQMFSQGSGGIEDEAESDDGFGGSLAAGDFDGDGPCDVAVGVPDEDVGAVVDGGAVNIIYGSPTGLNGDRDQFWNQDTPGVRDEAETFGDVGDRFGWSLAAGNFGKGYRTDLAIGVPLETVDTVFDGAVNVLYGSIDGLTADGDQFWGMGARSVSEATFGWSLSAANFGRTSRDDLAIGAPSRLCCVGSVRVLYGSVTGLTAHRDQWWSQNVPGIKGDSDEAQIYGEFGRSLAAADLGRSGEADLAVGVPGDGTFFQGTVNVIYGSAHGLAVEGNQLFRQGGDILGAREPGDVFGSSLTAANFGGSARADLAIGVPGEDVAGVADAGAANVIYGSSPGLTTEGNQLWHQASPGVNGVVESGDAFGTALG